MQQPRLGLAAPSDPNGQSEAAVLLDHVSRRRAEPASAFSGWAAWRPSPRQSRYTRLCSPTSPLDSGSAGHPPSPAGVLEHVVQEAARFWPPRCQQHCRHGAGYFGIGRLTRTRFACFGFRGFPRQA